MASDDADKRKQEPADEVDSLRQALSEQRALTEQLRAELDDYRLLVENSYDLVVKIDLRGRFLFVSPSYCTLFGHSADELLGKTVLECFSPTYCEGYYEQDKSVIETGNALRDMLELHLYVQGGPG